MQGQPPGRRWLNACHCLATGCGSLRVIRLPSGLAGAHYDCLLTARFSGTSTSANIWCCPSTSSVLIG